MFNVNREGIIFGLGNPLLDISVDVDANFLSKWGLDANSAILAEDKHNGLVEDMIKNYPADSIRYTAGGAVQNSLRVTQWFLNRPNACTFMGCIGTDFFGDMMAQKAGADGVNAIYSLNQEVKTGTCAVCITSGGTKRSLVAYLGAANLFRREHLVKNWTYVTQAELFYSSGFHLTVSPDSVLEIAKYSESQTSKVMTFNLSAPFISEFYGPQLSSVLPYVDILFGNETEAAAFGKNIMKWPSDMSVKEIAVKLSDLLVELKYQQVQGANHSKKTKIVVITQGADSVILVRNTIQESNGTTTSNHQGSDQTVHVKKDIFEYPVQKLAASKIIDTNGAGDAFVGGFISQLIQGQDMNVCVAAGIYGATEIIQLSGCTFPSECKFIASSVAAIDPISSSSVTIRTASSPSSV